MIISHYGHRLVRVYNRRNGTEHDARSFFDEVLFPVIYGTKEDEPFLQDAGNTPFGQADKLAKRIPLTPERRREVLATFHTKMEAAQPTGNDVMFGGSALEATASTSGLLTDLELPFRAEDAYASWLGAALAIGVQGGWCLLVDDEDILYSTFQGWQVYRRFLRETPGFKARQINTWNAHWLVHVLSHRSSTYPSTITAPEKENASIATLGWPQVLFALSARFDQPQTAYVYKLSQQNSTIGFVQLHLPQVASEVDWFDRLFSNEAALSRDAMMSLYVAHYGFDEACQMGVVGLRALEPKGMRAFYPSGDKSRMPDPNKTSIPLPIYQTWIVAMLEKDGKDLYRQAVAVADALLDFEDRAVGGKTDRRRALESLLEQKSRRTFIEKVTAVVEKEPEMFPVLDNLARATMPERMSPEQFRLFLTLIKFQVAGRRYQRQQQAIA